MSEIVNFEVSGGVWGVSGGCLEGVWRVSGWSLFDPGYFQVDNNVITCYTNSMNVM